MKRNARNIGKIVTIQGPEGYLFNGREGKVVGFRGDYDKGIPWVQVFVYPNNGVWPFRGDWLKEKKKATMS